jgi:hypothetical protein
MVVRPRRLRPQLVTGSVDEAIIDACFLVAISMAEAGVGGVAAEVLDPSASMSRAEASPITFGSSRAPAAPPPPPVIESRAAPDVERSEDDE